MIGSFKLLSWDVEPGDVIAFHMKTLHGTPEGRVQSAIRRAIAFRWLGNDMRHCVRPWKTSPPFEREREDFRNQGIEAFVPGTEVTEKIFPKIG